MKIIDIDKSDYNNFDVSMSDLENFFNIYDDKRSFKNYNLNTTMYINVNVEDCDQFVLQHDMFWPLISYKIYGTTRLAWLLQKINKVVNPMNILQSGSIVYYINKSNLSQVLQEVNS